MTDRLEELAKMAYGAWHPDAHTLWSELRQTHRDIWLRIARTLYAAIMAEAAGVASGEAPFLCCDDTDDAVARTATRIATALLAKVKEIAP